MATENYSGTFTDLSAIRALFNTIENLAAEAMELKDDSGPLRSSMLWAIQMLAEVAQKDIGQMEEAAG